MDDYSERRPKKDGIKAHKAAQKRKGEWLGRPAVNRERKTQREHSVYSGEHSVRPENDYREDYAGRAPGNTGEEHPDRETRRRLETARLKRRQKRQIQRLVLIGMLLLVLVLGVLLIRAVAKGISKKTKEAKARAEALELEEKEPKIKEATAVITTAGDIIMHKPFLESSTYYDGENYDYNAIFTYMKEIYESADFAAVTTE